jgi:hypothetical protein
MKGFRRNWLPDDKRYAMLFLHYTRDVFVTGQARSVLQEKLPKGRTLKKVATAGIQKWNMGPSFKGAVPFDYGEDIQHHLWEQP